MDNCPKANQYLGALQNEDLLRRCTDAEDRCQALSSAVPDSTRPLLRQIDSLHANFSEKARVWEQVELSLRQVAMCRVCGRVQRNGASWVGVDGLVIMCVG